MMEQIHGNNVVKVSSKDLGKIINKCDGLITNDPSAVLSVHVADCLPIFFYSPIKSSIGLVHAGWRGLDNHIIKVTVEKMVKQFEINLSDLHIYIGPHVCQKHYEVKKDILEKFKGYKSAIKIKKDKNYLDLSEIARRQLVDLEIKNEKIKIDLTCTFENHNLDSWRRKDLRRKTCYCFRLP